MQGGLEASVHEGGESAVRAETLEMLSDVSVQVRTCQQDNGSWFP